MRKAILATAAFLGSLLLLPQARAEAAEAHISPIKVAIDGDRVLAEFALRHGFDDKRITRRIESGLATSILYRIELYRDRKHWFDQLLKENSLEVVVIYDAVARVYNVHFKLDDKLIESRALHDLKTVEETMTQIGPLPVFPVSALPDRGRLLLKVRAEMGSSTTLSMIPVSITTGWESSPKFRAPAPPNAAPP